MFTWFVNGDNAVQIYKGEVQSYQIKDLFFNNDYASNTYDVPEPNYYIPADHAEMFFTLIGSPTWCMGTIGCTDVNVSDFLD